MNADLRPDPELAARAERATPPMSLDPDALLHAAHRHVRHRAVARAGGAVAAVAVLASAVLVTPRLSATPDPAESAPSPSQSARPSGEGATRTVATGLVAVNDPGDPRPVTGIITSLVDGAEQRVDLGLRSGDRELVLVVGGDTSGDPTGWASFYSEGDGWGGSRGGGAWTWDAETRHSGARLTSEPSPGTTAEVVVVPTDLPDPHVLLWSTSGFPVGDRLVTAVELPTFAAPGGQLLSATLADADLTSAMAASSTGVVFVGADGTVVRAPCADMPIDECPTVDEVPGLAAAVAALTGVSPTASTAEPSSPVASAAQPAVTIGDGDVAELERHVQATNHPVERADGTWDTGLAYGDHGAVSLAANPDGDAIDVHYARPDADDEPFLDLAVVDTEGATPPPLLDGTDGEQRLILGAVPVSVRAPHVVLYLDPEGDDAGGWIELPTFADPTGSGRLLYVAVLPISGQDDPAADPRSRPFVFDEDGTWQDASGACVALPACHATADLDGKVLERMVVEFVASVTPEQPDPAATTITDWGIVHDEEAFFPGAEFVGSGSYWVGVVDGSIVEVHPGRDGSEGDPTTGVLVVRTIDGTGAPLDGRRYELAGSGTLSLVEVDGSLVVLADATGAHRWFDLDTSAWVS